MKAVIALLALTGAVYTAAAPGQEVATASSVAEQRTERGPVSALVRVEPDVVRIGDPVTLTVEVTAEAGVELLMPVFGASLERFAILEFVPRERLDDTGGTVSTQRYLLQPATSGEHAIPPITVEFVDRRPGQRAAPDDEDAFELLTERVPFRVESVVPAGAGDALVPPLGPLGALDREHRSGSTWFAVAAALGVTGVLALLLARGRGRRRQTSAYEVALTRLVALEARPRPVRDEMDGFFVELSDLVRHYLEDRFALHAPELTTEEFLDVAASSPDLTREHRNFLQMFLGSADRVKFARHVPPSEEVEGALGAVRAFLEQTSDEDPSPAAETARA